MNELRGVGRVLLVGEGDFSFSVALQRAAPHARLHTSSLLKEDALLERHSRAKANIELLLKKGAVVLFATDATNLGGNEELKGQRFDRVIFNFPHVGGKSNIKRNRELLKEFFISASTLLADDADICVTLCKGQGGTPADGCVREWADTWQVVAMATYSRLVLTRVDVFETSAYDGYTCTGYRGKDRNFLTEGALTHVFRRVPPLLIPPKAALPEGATRGVLTSNGQEYEISRYIAEKLRRMESRPDSHPVVRTERHLISSLKMLFGGEESVRVVADLPLVLRGASDARSYAATCVRSANGTSTGGATCGGEQYYSTAAKRAKIAAAASVGAATGDDSEKCRPEKSCMCEKTGTATGDDAINCSRDTCSEWRSDTCAHRLRTSLLSCGGLSREASGWLVAGGTAVIASGAVVSRSVLIDARHGTPVTRELMLLAGGQCSPVSLAADLAFILRRALPAECDVTTAADDAAVSPWGRDAVTVMVRYTTDAITPPCNRVAERGAYPREGEAGGDRPVSVTVGRVGVIGGVLALAVDVSRVTLAVLGGEDARDLWRDPSVTPHSLYPPLWRHDLGFWLSDSEECDEAVMVDVIRDVCGDTMRKLILMNSWTQPETGRRSRCYRQVYQSNELAVSHDMAHALQNTVRLTVADRLKVELR